MTLRIKFEIVPHGDEDRVRELGRIDVHNMGSSRTSSVRGESYRDYLVEASGEDIPEGVSDWIRDYHRDRGYFLLAVLAVNTIDIKIQARHEENEEKKRQEAIARLADDP